MISNTQQSFPEAVKIAHLVRRFGDPILRAKCTHISEVEISNEVTLKLAHALVNTLAQVRQLTGLGRGLAAPQIGVSKRMFVIFYNDKYQVLINPKIVQTSDELGIYPEMCLSGIPLASKVVRPWEVEIEYSDIKGHKHRLTADPFLSRTIQHELDHLNGVLCIDKSEPQTIELVRDVEEYKRQAELLKVRCLQ